MASHAAEHRIVAAIDFGTHGTGFAWCVVEPLNEDPQTRRIVHFMDYAENTSYPKNLSAVLVDSGSRVVEWGHRAKELWDELSETPGRGGHGFAVAYKMALGREHGGLELPSASGPVDLADPECVRGLISGCLAKVRALVLDQIRPSGYRPAEVLWCLTVPAIWDEYDKQVMRRAAVEAGFPDDEDRLLLVYEPEAAAIASHLFGVQRLDGSGEQEKLGLRVRGSRTMVVDCGGGTVDIAAYESVSDEGIELRQIGTVCGGKFGSEYVNHAFRDRVLAERFGADVLEHLEAEAPNLVHALIDAWEEHKLKSVKTTVDTDGRVIVTSKARVNVPGELWALLDSATRQRLTEQAGRAYRILVAPEEVQELFDKVVDPMLDVIAEQLQAMRDTPSFRGGSATRPETLLLVGGFARSTYLRERVQARFGADVMVLVPPDAALAVLDGAVHYAYDPGIVSFRRSRYTYGLDVLLPFREGVDPDEYRRQGDKGVRCANRFRVLVTRGAVVATDTPVPVTYTPLTRRQVNIALDVFRTRKLDPVYVTDDACEKIGDLVIDISDTVNQDADTREVDVAVYFGRTEITVEAVARSNGKRVSTKVRFHST